jgi:UDP-N-acetyl-D-glucosamine dehydrogenase
MELSAERKLNPDRLPIVESLKKKILDRSASLGVIGLGYAGLPLTLEMARQGYHVTGIDIDGDRVQSVNSGISYIPDVGEKDLFDYVTKGYIRATQSFSAVEALDTISICVPTPLRKTKDPDLSYIVAAAEAIRSHLTPGKLIILESTTYPGTTREVVLPILEKSGHRVGRDFFLAYSPERIDPGNRIFTTRNIPKVLGGVTPFCTSLASLFYQQLVEHVVPLSSSECAEMVKLLENTFRSVNIALANEFACMCRKFDINVWEIIEAARSKPFGFMPFYPGPGLGGTQMPAGAQYLSWKARLNGFEPRLIDMASAINAQMPEFTVNRVAEALNTHRKSLNGSKILALGVAYKRDVCDIRESAAVETVAGLMARGAHVLYSDPYVKNLKIHGKLLASSDLNPQLFQSVDCVVILTDHTCVDYAMVVSHSPLILDCRNALKDFSSPNVILY